MPIPDARLWFRAFAVMCAAAAVALTLSPAATAASSSSKLLTAGAKHRVADRAVVKSAKTLSRCQRVSSKPKAACKAKKRALQRAGHRLNRAARKLKQVAARTSGASTAAQTAPTLKVSGTSLTWSKVSNVNSYVFVRKVPGQADQYSVVNGTSITPPAVPGTTVRYSVRTAVDNSKWASPEQSISYPSPTVEVNRKAAPTLTISGNTVSWRKIADVDTYVLVTKVPGLADSYSVVNGTSVTPPVVAGKTVSYSVRTAVDGSAWAVEKQIAYPAAPTAPKPAEQPAGQPAEQPKPAPTSPAFKVGIVVGSATSWELPFATQVKAGSARMEFPIGASVADLKPAVEAYWQAGIRPLLLAGFAGRTPTVAEAKNLATWAAAFGPGGSARQGKSYAASTAVTAIEFGNESSYSYQYPSISSSGDWAKTSTYATTATNYGLRFKDAQEAIRSANPEVGLLAVGDVPGNWTTWMDNIFRAVPDFGSRVAGWTVHPYGPNWKTTIDNTIERAKAHGAPDSIPLYVTEFGIATDDGRCLSDNYGWDKCMTYSAAASALTGAVDGMHSRYGSRLREVYLYQAHDLSDSGTTTDRERYFGAVTLKGGAKGAFTTSVTGLLTKFK